MPIAYIASIHRFCMIHDSAIYLFSVIVCFVAIMSVKVVDSYISWVDVVIAFR